MWIYLDSSSTSVAPPLSNVPHHNVAVELWSIPMWALLGILLGREIYLVLSLDGSFIFGRGPVCWA